MKFIKLCEDSILPERKTRMAAAYDFCAHKTVRILPGEAAIIPTGIAFEEMPEDQFLQLSLRSGFSVKRPFLMTNGIGIIDADFNNREIGIPLYNRGNVPATVDAGERVAQGVLLSYHTVTDEKKPTTERKGGFGSTNEEQQLEKPKKRTKAKTE